MKRLIAVLAAVVLGLSVPQAAMAGGGEISASFAHSSLRGLVSSGYAPDNDVYLLIKSWNDNHASDVYSWNWSGDVDGGDREVFSRVTLVGISGNILKLQWFRAWWDKRCGTDLCPWEYHDGQVSSP